MKNIIMIKGTPIIKKIKNDKEIYEFIEIWEGIFKMGKVHIKNIIKYKDYNIICEDKKIHNILLAMNKEIIILKAENKLLKEKNEN